MPTPKKVITLDDLEDYDELIKAYIDNRIAELVNGAVITGGSLSDSLPVTPSEDD